MNLALFAPEIHPPFIEGIQKTAWAVSGELVKRRQSHVIFTQRSYGDVLFERDISAYRTVVYVFSVISIKLFKYCAWFFNACTVALRLRHERITHLLVFSLDAPFLPALAVSLMICPDISVRCLLFSTRELGGVQRIFLLLFGKRIERYFVRSRFMAQALAGCGIAADRITEYLFFDHSFFSRLRADISRDEHAVMYLSSADTGAGIDAVVAAAQALPAFHFIFAIREFSSRNEASVVALEQRIREFGITNIELLRNIDDVALLLQRVGVVVVPPRTDYDTMNVPLVMLEAFVAKTPVIVRAISSFQEFIEEGYSISFTDHDLAKKISGGVARDQVERAYRFVAGLPDVSVAVDRFLW